MIKPRKKTERRTTTTTIAPRKQNRSKETNKFVKQFPSLAGLVSIDLPTHQPPVTTSTTTVQPRRTKTTTTTKKPRKSAKKNPKEKNLTIELSCPPIEKIPFQWFPLPCDSHKQCTRSMGKNYRCCEINSNSYKSCTKGVLKPVPEQKHSREWDGVILEGKFEWEISDPLRLFSDFWSSREMSKSSSGRVVLERAALRDGRGLLAKGVLSGREEEVLQVTES